eukprot:scaffold207192_cov19-Tisochrysis_lutea.AAC.2
MRLRPMTLKSVRWLKSGCIACYWKEKRPRKGQGQSKNVCCATHASQSFEQTSTSSRQRQLRSSSSNTALLGVSP